MLDTTKKVLEKIDCIRRVRRLTQAELGARTGVRQSVISRWLKGKSGMTIKVLVNLCNATDHTILIVPKK